MINPKNTIKELLKQSSETEVFELKEANTNFDFDKLGRYFSALSNEANLKHKSCGYLVFGVKDSDRSLVNTQYRRDGVTLQKLKGEVASHTGGITFIEIHDVEFAPGKRVILFEIPPAPMGMPTAWKGHFYARDHEELKPMNMEKIERIRSQSKREDWSMNICEGATVSDLDHDAVARARELFKRKNAHLSAESDKWDDITFLNKTKVTINGRITNTAIILLGKPESTHFLSPAVAKISWILKSKEGVELDYEHFTSPLILAVDEVYSKIRNLKYRYIADESLFPEEVYKYDPYVIREALNNCIAHQDYTLGGKINIVENEEDSLVFTNLGAFLPVSIENVINTDAPSEFYRNRFLADAMVNLNMIDTIGSGIRKMFISQKEKYFPLPEYELENNKVVVSIIGKVLDMNYARKLATIPDLTLSTIMLLDKVQKKKHITGEEAKILRSQGLIEGTRPNLYVSSKVANKINERAEYMKRRGIDDAYCMKIIREYLEKFDKGTRTDFESILLEKLPEQLSINQKKNKIKNILQRMRNQGDIKLSTNKEWVLANK